MNADAAGNSLPVGDVRVRVERSVPATEGSDAVIEVSVTQESAAVAELTEPAAIAGRRARAPFAGLSYEEELFRTKWGWAAFAEAQRVGRETGGSAP